MSQMERSVAGTSSRSSHVPEVVDPALRSPVASIKQAILHPDARTRHMAIHYFADTYATDRSIMPLVIEALEKYGRGDEAYMTIGIASNLPQTADTIDWTLEELGSGHDSLSENYWFNLERVLFSADPQLLQPRFDDIAALARPGARDIIAERIDMLSWDAGRCWCELEQHCEEHQSVTYANEAGLGRAGWIVKALARHDVDEERVLGLLRRQVAPEEDSPMKWMEPMVVALAGRLRLESTIPLLIDKMQLDDDVLQPECENALIHIGGDDPVRAVVAAFADAAWTLRISATGVLRAIHSDLAVQSMLELLRHETDPDLKCFLRSALLAQFSPAAIEPARHWLLEQGSRNPERSALRDNLLRVCDVLGRTIPEYEKWKADQKQNEQERLRIAEKSKSDPMKGLLHAMERFTDEKPSEMVEEDEEPAADPIGDTPPPSIRSSRQHVGRNDPCPCGSGKKFKKCCMRK